MKLLRDPRFNARWAMILFLLCNLLPAFGTPGKWVCPDGTVCPLMKGTSTARMESPTPVKKCHLKKRMSCCVKSAVLTSIDSAKGCKFIAYGTSLETVRLAPTPVASEKMAATLLPVRPLHELFAAFSISEPDIPLPPNDQLPPPPLRSASPSRAPPLV